MSSKEPTSITNDDIKYLKSLIYIHSDFPKLNIIFYDLFPMLSDVKSLNIIIENLIKHYETNYNLLELNSFVGIESRGFIIASILSYKLNKSFIPIRKKGKLPGTTISQEYKKEYGDREIIEIQANVIKPNMNVIIIDDILASGGTLEASKKLIKKCHGNVFEVSVILELKEFNGREKIDDVYSIFKI